MDERGGELGGVAALFAVHALASLDGRLGAGVKRFGHLDVLVNNAGSFNAGFFEEMTPEAFRAQIETTLFGPVKVS